jgi:hypothetical protein
LSDNSTAKFCTDACPCKLNTTNLKSDLAEWLTTNGRKNFSNVTGNINYRTCIAGTPD